MTPPEEVEPIVEAGGKYPWSREKQQDMLAFVPLAAKATKALPANAKSYTVRDEEGTGSPVQVLLYHKAFYVTQVHDLYDPRIHDLGDWYTENAKSGCRVLWGDSPEKAFDNATMIAGWFS